MEPVVTHPFHHLFFQHPQQLDLGGQGQVADFIQKDIAAAAASKRPSRLRWAPV
jgi:hypothetical protein